MTQKTVYEKYCNGDKLTDAELELGIAHFGLLSEMLFASGIVFKLAAAEAGRVEQMLSSFKHAREDK